MVTGVAPPDCMVISLLKGEEEGCVLRCVYVYVWQAEAAILDVEGERVSEQSAPLARFL